MQRFISLLTLLIIFSTTAFSQEKYTISGYVKDKRTGEAMIGATVYAEGLSVGTSANEYGYFSLTLPKGEYTIVISFIGYDNYTQKVILDKNIKINTELGESAEQMDVFEVVDEKEQKANVEDVQMSVVKLDIDAIKKVPAFMGEVDVIKTMTLMPGIQSGGEGNNGFFVRGGGSDQNLVLLDEATVYNASHLLGFFSVFNGDAIKDLQIYKGGIPARYGGRLSSLLDIKMKEGNSKKFSSSGGIGTVSSRLTLEGPIVKDKGSFILSGRRTYADQFLRFAKDTSLRKNKLYFYDFNAKANYIINDKNRIFVSGYFGRDVFRFGDEFSMSWGNSTGTVRWNHLFNDKLFSNVTFIASKFDYNLGVPDGIQEFNWESNIIDYSLKADFSYFINPKNTLKFGAQSIQHTFKPGTIIGGEESVFNAFVLPDNYGLENAVYIGNEQEIGTLLTIEYGIRFSSFHNLGKTTYYEYDKSNPDLYTSSDTIETTGGIYQSYYNPEPRFSAKYTLNEFSSIKASYNRTAQYLQLANNSVSASPLALWFPSSPNVKPQQADQVAAGYFRNFKKNMFETSIEVYYKWMYNSIDFRDHAQLLLNKFLEGELRIGKSWSYGTELLVRKNQGKFTGWVAYTLSRTQREIAEINNGNTYLAPYDRTHDVSVVGSYEISKRVDVGMTWVYSTGAPITVPTGRFTYKGNVIPVYSDRNAERMPSYHRLDLSVTVNGKTAEEKGPKKNGKKRWGYQSSWNFSAYNVYMRKNAFTINFQQSKEDPTVTEAYKIYLFSIVPSITYNFKF